MSADWRRAGGQRRRAWFGVALIVLAVAPLACTSSPSTSAGGSSTSSSVFSPPDLGISVERPGAKAGLIVEAADGADLARIGQGVASDPGLLRLNQAGRYGYSIFPDYGKRRLVVEWFDDPSSADIATLVDLIKSKAGVVSVRRVDNAGVPGGSGSICVRRSAFSAAALSD